LILGYSESCCHKTNLIHSILSLIFRFVRYCSIQARVLLDVAAYGCKTFVLLVSIEMEIIVNIGESDENKDKNNEICYESFVIKNYFN